MQMYISFKLFNVENVVTLLAAELKCVLNYRPYIRGECNHLVGWHRSRVFVRAPVILFTVCFVMAGLGYVCTPRVSDYWVGGVTEVG